MDGVGGLSNWRWVFILEGIVTIIVGISAYFLVADFPENASWLTEDERSWVLVRTGRDKTSERITLQHILRFFSDVKNVLGGIIYFGRHSHNRQQLPEYANNYCPSYGCANLQYV